MTSSEALAPPRRDADVQVKRLCDVQRRRLHITPEREPICVEAHRLKPPPYRRSVTTPCPPRPP